jgi:hypothetical protein
MTGEGVFMFADDGLSLFPSVEDAAGYMEWVDVENGDIYEALFTVEGERLLPHQLNEYGVPLERSGQVDIESLRSLLRRERDKRGTFTGDPDDPAAVAKRDALEGSGVAVVAPMAQVAALAGRTSARVHTPRRVARPSVPFCRDPFGRSRDPIGHADELA